MARRLNVARVISERGESSGGWSIGKKLSERSRSRAESSRES